MNDQSQGSAGWLAARAGHCTASRFKDVLARGKAGAEAATRKAYRLTLVTERLTGQPAPSYENDAMRWGKEQEPFARAAHESLKGMMVDEVGLILHPDMRWVGGSPDGLLGDDGIAEYKCPYNSVVHVETLQGGMPPEHYAQIQGLLWITNREWCDFCSFDPRMPPKLQLYVERVKRDETYIQNLIAEVTTFLAEVEKQHEWLMKAAS